MKPEDILKKVDLTKWPAFVVEGESVTTDQAKEILIRTSNIQMICTNDKYFLHDIWKSVGLTPSEHGYSVEWSDENQNRLSEIDKEICPIKFKDCDGYEYHLEFCNNSQIASAWVGGPHGWVDWSGRVGCNNYNVGKWPSPKNFYDEWTAIAKDFPYLDLKCQLWDGETCEEPIKPAIQYTIKDGEVSVEIPEKGLRQPVSCEFNIGVPGRERGCTIEQFVDAYEHTKKVVAERSKHGETE